MPSPKNVVITGSTRGIGHGLADAFLQLGCNVVLSGRSEEATASAAEQLSEKSGAGRVHGLACDVTVPEQVEALWAGSLEKVGRIDIWVNNAGHAGEMAMVWQRPAAEAQSVIDTNLVGTIFGSQVAMHGDESPGRRSDL